MIIKENYRLNKNVSSNILTNNGFRNNTFRCYIYKDIIQLILRVDLEENNWYYEIYDTNSDGIYAQYYCRNNKNLVVEEIDKKLETILNELVNKKILTKRKGRKKVEKSSTV